MRGISNQAARATHLRAELSYWYDELKAVGIDTTPSRYAEQRIADLEARLEELRAM